MPTINGNAYEPVEVMVLDLIGFLGEEGFVILNPNRNEGRKLPVPTIGQELPWCIRCKIKNNQEINFHGKFATLHDINGEWHVKSQESGKIQPLVPHTFFEIGHMT